MAGEKLKMGSSIGCYRIVGEMDGARMALS